MLLYHSHNAGRENLLRYQHRLNAYGNYRSQVGTALFSKHPRVYKSKTKHNQSKKQPTTAFVLPKYFCSVSEFSSHNSNY